MIEAGQNLALVPELPQQGLGVHAPLDELDRDALLVLLVGALRQVDRAHPASAHLANQDVGADAPARGRRLAFRGPDPLVVGPQIGVSGAGALQEGTPFRGAEAEGVVEQVVEALPALGVVSGRRIAHRGLPSTAS
jgi:hypothetical protein